MDTLTLIFTINIIVLCFGLIGLKYPFVALFGLCIGLVVILPNLSILSGILLAFSVVSIVVSSMLFVFSMVKGED